MKKRIVWFLCELGCFCVAEKISLMYVCDWRLQKSAKRVREALERLGESAKILAMAMQKVGSQAEEYMAENNTEIEEDFLQKKMEDIGEEMHIDRTACYRKLKKYIGENLHT